MIVKHNRKRKADWITDQLRSLAEKKIKKNDLYMRLCIPRYRWEKIISKGGY